MGNEYLAWFDGACEPVNPGGTATFGVIIKDNDGAVLLKEHGFVGTGSKMSNNVAEYAGVLHILKYFAPRPPGRATIHGDSKLVINQLNGKWRIRKGLYLPTAIEAKELLANTGSIRKTHQKDEGFLGGPRPLSGRTYPFAHLCESHLSPRECPKPHDRAATK
jgi:ribonuclease HI